MGTSRWPTSHWDQFFSLIQIALCISIIWWVPYAHLPAPGWAVAYIAIAAALMSVHAQMGNWQKGGWLLLMAFFLMIEFRAISKDRWDNEQQQKRDRAEERQGFKDLLIQENKDYQALLGVESENLKQILKQQQAQFESTLTTFEKGQKAERLEFAGVLTKQQELFDHEEQLAASLNGNLVAGNEPTPANICGSIPSDAIRVFIGDAQAGNVSIVNKFPKVVLAAYYASSVNPNGEFSIGTTRPTVPLVTLDRHADGTLTVILEERSKDGRIIVKMNRDGFVVNRNNFLELKKDKNSLTVIDEFGRDVLNVRYLNRKAIVINGKDIDLHGVTHSCTQEVEPIVVWLKQP